MTRRRQPGRPSQDEDFDARSALLDAARTTFCERGFHGATVRRIAEQARVTPALVAYHFGDKAGLFKALLEAAMDPMYERLARLAEGRDETPVTLHRFLDAASRFVDANRWLPALLLRDVFSPDAPFAEYFAERLVARNRVLIEGLIRRGQADGTLRQDIDPRHGALALVSMMMFPYVAWPVASRVFELEGDAAFREQWIEQCERLLSPTD